MSSIPLNYDKWANKTKAKRRRTRSSLIPISKLVDEGYRHFWARRKANPFGGGM